MNERDELERFMLTLDPPHLEYARGYADQLSVGEQEPSSAGLDRAIVKEIRRRLWAEWQRRVSVGRRRRP